ncbi:MAG: PAS domain S-box protein, partial [Rhodothermales bacterium]|nr:PAS domain S-box protein [Rhodothermales bacterium]
LADDGVIDFIPEYVNDVVGSIIGVDPSFLIGMSLRNDCPVSLRVGIGDTIARAYTTGEARESEFQVDRSSGDVIWLRVQAVPYSKGVGVVVRDVTERRRREAELAAYREQLEGMVKARTAKLKRSEAEFRSVVESARDIMGIVDENHNYLFVNEAARSSRQETIIGRRAGSWVLESHHEAFHNEIDKVFETSEERRLEVPVEWSDGSVRWMDCRFSPVSSGGPGVEAVTVISRDVTEQREAQEQIRELNRDLEQRVEDRIAEIRALIDTSRRLAALMDEDDILNTVTETLLSVIPGALGVAIWSRESGGSPYGLLRFDGTERTDPASDVLDPDGRIMEHVTGRADSGSAVLITADDDATELTGLTQLDSCRRALATKISDARGLELIVAVAIDEESTAVDDRSRSFIDSVAAQAAVAVNNARLFREIRAVSVRLLHVQENERRDVAHELHDQVGGLLTSLQFLLQASKPEEEAGSAAIAEARQMVKTLMEEVRSLTLTLRPALLDDFGLVPALEGLISRHRKQGALDVDLDVDFDRNRRFPADVETAVYRVVQEALTNVIRHAETGTATVELSISDDRLEARIHDDGKGFDVDRAVTRSRSMGVRGMIERVELLEGRARIDTHPGQGTRVQFHVPLHPNGRAPS